MKTNSDLICDVVEQLYDYLVAVSAATHLNNRPGITWERPANVRTASCGAFRDWGIYAVSGRIAIAADGFRMRENRRRGGSLMIHVGDGTVKFPPDDSRSSHSLSLRVDGDGKLVNVTSEDGPWKKYLPDIAESLRVATESVKNAVAEYDERKRTEREQSRNQDLMDAAVAVLQ